jgi:general secretion pathway protein G
MGSGQGGNAQVRRRQTGFTLLEFGVAAAILGIAAALLLERLVYYQEVVEKLHMELTARALKSALRMEIANDLMAGRRISVERLVQGNPMEWLGQKPANYAGETTKLGPDRLQQGNWYFDRDHNELVYLVNRGRYFLPDSTGYKRVRYIVRPVQGQEWVGLVEIEPYRWEIP